MKLLEMLSSQSYKLLQGTVETEVSEIAFDSRKVVNGGMFVCISGFQTDGHRFIPQAISNGAKVLVVEYPVLDIPSDITVIQVADSRKVLPQLSSIFYGEPTKQVNLVGITGTNGKTSVSFLVSKILSNVGRIVGIAGTIRKQVGEKEIPFETTTPTTPEASDLQRLFRMMVEEQAQDIIMEVSSIALELGRVDGCQFRVGVFTNLTQDHLDDHGTMENYKNAKLKLFNRCEINVINRDDPVSEEILAKGSGVMLSYGIEHREADLKASQITINSAGITFMIHYKEQKQPVKLSIPGRFSVYNALAATGVCLSLGLSLPQIAAGLATIEGVKGRFESVKTPYKYSVIVDYAHSADALENVLQTIKEFATGRIITVFGCGGDRDPGKRPVMGKIAGQHSDLCIVTSDNPRTEDPEKILSEVEAGLKDTGCQYEKWVDRKEAIHHAMNVGEDHDVILIAGKGHENYQEINGHKKHFDDVEVVEEYVIKQQNLKNE